MCAHRISQVPLKEAGPDPLTVLLSVCALSLSSMQLKNTQGTFRRCKGPEGELKWVSLDWDSRTPLWTGIFRLRLEEWEGAKERETTAKHPGTQTSNAKSKRQNRTCNFRKTESRPVQLDLSEGEDIEGRYSQTGGNGAHL